MKHILLSFNLLFVSLAYGQQTLSGGNEVGNGGDVIVCKTSDSKSSVTLLDFYEAKEKDGKEITNSLTDTNAILESIIRNLKLADSKRAALFENKIRNFHKETNFVSGVKLSDIPDSFHLVMPKDKSCKLEQIAILDKNHMAKDKKFIVNKELWDSMGPLHQAGLIFHEVIYDYFSSLGEKNSIKARAYNAFIFRNYSSEEYWKFIKGLRISIYR